MVVTVQKNEFIAGLRRAAAAIDGKGNFSVSVKLNKNGGLNLILYTAGIFYANVVIPCEAKGAEGETSVVLPRDFLNAANALSKLGDEFILDFSDHNLKLSCGQGVITVDYIANGDVAELPAMSKLGVISLNTEGFHKAINVVKNSIDPAEKGAVLRWQNCIGLIPIEKGDVKKLMITASCTVGISVTELNVESVQLEGDMPSLSIPVGALSTIIGSLSGEKCKINIMAKKSSNEGTTPSPAALFIADEKASYVLMLLTEKYPDRITQSIEGIVPGCKFKALMSKEEFSNAIRVASFGDSKKGISLKVADEGFLRVSSQSSVNYVDVKAITKGSMEETRLNPFHLERIVNAYSGGKVAILTNSDTGMAARSPMMSKIILISGGEEGDSLIMPISDSTSSEAMAKTEEARKKSEKETADKEAALEE